MSKEILQTTSSLLAELKPSENKVANYVLKHYEAVLNQSIASVAAKSKVSEPTVIRYCRSIGCKGFQDFKIQLASSLAKGTPYIHESIEESDDVKLMAEKICNYSANSLRIVNENLNIKLVEKAIDLLEKAKRIEIYGSGTSGIVALDAQHKFFHTGANAMAYRDTHMQMMSASTLGPGDMALLFSYTGRSKNIVDAARLAKKQGAIAIGVTRKNSPLQKLCNPAILIPKIEDTSIFSPMVSRICQLIIVDILATGVAQRRGKRFKQNIKEIKKSIRGMRPKKGH
jgi:RpiR family transcriptional regulator, carbohydrate utilization regulator